jgi:hypothetical protein
MALTSKQREALAQMRGVVQSYRTLSVNRVRRVQHLARELFGTEIDIRPTIAAVRSRRGDRIYAELGRLRSIIDGLEKHA